MDRMVGTWVFENEILGCGRRSSRNSARSPWNDPTTSSSSPREAGSVNGPHALAIAHNLVISLVRIKGTKAIKETRNEPPATGPETSAS